MVAEEIEVSGDEYRHDGRRSPAEIAAPLIERLRRNIVVGSSIFVAIDGRSGAGKSTVSAALVDALSEPGSVEPTVVVIEGDQFYAGGSAATWDGRSVVERANRVIDWRRQHRLLSDLRSKGEVLWHAFDWDSEDWDSDEVPLQRKPVRSAAAPVVVLEGAYSARPELHDLLDVLVLLEVPRDVRRRQLLAREGADYRADWEARWSGAEDHYFGSVMRPSRFDLLLGGADR